MNWTNPPATERQTGHPERLGQETQHPTPPAGSTPLPPPPPGKPPEIKVGKSVVLTEVHGKHDELTVFTMTLGEETIELIPLKSWSQLDIYKWTMRGRLPATPAGLDVAPDHVKLLGEMASLKDPNACEKLEKLFEEWLEMERQTLEQARKKAQLKPVVAAPTETQAGPQPVRFHVELDKSKQVHVRVQQGKEELAVIGLNLPGFSGLFSQGLMRKPRSIKVGALHDWIELDGVLFSFEKGNNDAAKLEQTLNERYAPEGLGRGKEVVVFANPASSTGFDIQFPVMQGGVRDNHRRPLNEESLELLQDPNACGLLHKGTIIKLARPDLIFKQKTPDGGERYLERGPQNTVIVTTDEGQEKAIDLSRPVSYLRLSSVELTAIFNHPAINRHSQAAPPGAGQAEPQHKPEPPKPAIPEPVPAESAAPPPTPPQPAVPAPPPSVAAAAAAPSPAAPLAPVTAPTSLPARQGPAEPAERDPGAPGRDSLIPLTVAPAPKVEPKPQPLPNLWLEPLLDQTPLRHDWLACLIYGRMAQHFGNSSEGHFGPSACWAISLGDTTDPAEPDFSGIFLTEKHSLGFLNRGHLARFSNGVVFIGTPQSALEGIEINLVATGMDADGRVVFVVTDGYRKKFGVPNQTLTQELERLQKYGAVVMSIPEVLASSEPVAILWTAPESLQSATDPEAIESVRGEEG